MSDEQDSVPASHNELEALRQRVAELEAQVEKESAQATDYMKRLQYAQAEIANIRRRTQQERDDLQKYGTAPLAAALCEVLDNFERAEQTIPRGLQSLTWISGVLLIQRQLDYLLQQNGVEAILSAGEKFDPQVHDAIVEEFHATVPAGTIIADVQKGYKLHGRILRPSLVRLSKGAEAKPDAVESETVSDEANSSTAATNE